jgi:hypothetical protein
MLFGDNYVKIITNFDGTTAIFPFDDYELYEIDGYEIEDSQKKSAISTRKFY